MIKIKDLAMNEYYVYNGDKTSLLLDTLIESNSYYLLTKSEFLTTGNLVGFWYYATIPGDISIIVKALTFNGIFLSLKLSVLLIKLANLDCSQYVIGQCTSSVYAGDQVYLSGNTTFNLTISKIGHDFYKLDQPYEISNPNSVLLLHLKSASIGLTQTQQLSDYLLLDLESSNSSFSGRVTNLNKNPSINGKFLLRGKFYFKAEMCNAF
jgi:hypothetical protein